MASPKVSPGTWSAFNRFLYVSFKQNSGERFRATWPSCWSKTKYFPCVVTKSLKALKVINHIESLAISKNVFHTTKKNVTRSYYINHLMVYLLCLFQCLTSNILKCIVQMHAGLISKLVYSVAYVWTIIH